jgi:hypothetical protein
MILNYSVTLNTHNESSIVSSLEPVIIDDISKKLVLVRLLPYLSPLVLWRGDDYDNAGDYTQAQVEEKILELIGSNPQEKLQSLVLY